MRSYSNHCSSLPRSFRYSGKQNQSNDILTTTRKFPAPAPTFLRSGKNLAVHRPPSRTTCESSCRKYKLEAPPSLSRTSALKAKCKRPLQAGQEQEVGQSKHGPREVVAAYGVKTATKAAGNKRVCDKREPGGHRNVSDPPPSHTESGSNQGAQGTQRAHQKRAAIVTITSRPREDRRRIERRKTTK